MPKTLTKDSILQAVAEEKLGFKFGKPDRPNESSLACILPILRETTHKRQYVTMPETEHVIVTDSGTINKVNLKNSGKENVFLRSGTIFEGKGTQSRIITRSAVLFPGSEVALDARCVHASHGIRSGSEFKYGGTVPVDVETANYTAGFTPVDQSRTWANVQRATTTMNTMAGRMGQQQQQPTRAMRSRTSPMASSRMQNWMRSPGFSLNKSADDSSERSGIINARLDSLSDINEQQFTNISAFAGSDNLKANFDAFAQDFSSILSKARLHDNQAGLALITVSGCKTIELFDVPLSWEALHKDAVKRMGTELLRGEDKSNVFEYKPENAVNAVKKVLGLEYKSNLIYQHKPSNGEPHVSIFGLTASRYVGEVVEVNGMVIHLVILETATA